MAEAGLKPHHRPPRKENTVGGCARLALWMGGVDCGGMVVGDVDCRRFWAVFEAWIERNAVINE